MNSLINNSEHNSEGRASKAFVKLWNWPLKYDRPSTFLSNKADLRLNNTSFVERIYPFYFTTARNVSAGTDDTFFPSWNEKTWRPINNKIKTSRAA